MSANLSLWLHAGPHARSITPRIANADIKSPPRWRANVHAGGEPFAAEPTGGGTPVEGSTQHCGPGLDGPRPVRPQELPQVVDLVNQIFCVALGKPPTMGQQFPQLFSPANAANLFL